VWFGRWFGTAFPWGTLFINITGSLFLGWFATVISERWVPTPGAWLKADDLRLLIAVGFTGAYTTFSTFEFESHNLFKDGGHLVGTTYMALSVFVGLLAVRVGVVLAKMGGGAAS
jgi:CrcB protein